MMNNQKPVILIVEDAVENIDVLHNLLIKDYELKVARDGFGALKLITETKLPDLILLDIVMPKMDGYTTIKRIKNIPDARNIPVIFLTSKTDAEDVVKGFELGAVDYVGKPFNTPELISRVKTQIFIKKQKDLIEQRSNEQKELLQIMCHDLATHFSIIKSCIWLSENNNDNNLDSYKDRLKMATLYGIDIINLVREMRALEDKKLPLQNINLAPVISEAVKLQNDNLSQKQINIKVDIPDNLYINVEPRSFVNSVVNNILSNAIKFSFKNSDILITAIKSGQKIHLSFKDSGIGIPEDLINQLFKLSKKTNRIGTSGEKGTGFGMPLIKKFIELYGGSIEIKSRDIKKNKKDHGTEVLLYLYAG